MRNVRIAAVILSTGLSAFALAAEGGGHKSKLINADRQEIGEAIFSETPSGMLIRLGIRDLPNIHVPQSGPLNVETMIPSTTLFGGKKNLMDPDGFSLVIHQKANDYKSDPAGDSGDRVA